MIDELLCMTIENGEKCFSFSKFMARITYLGLGYGVGLGSRAIKNRM